MSDTRWILYKEQKPGAAGVYEWSVPSNHVTGRHISFAGHLRRRSANGQKVLSPNFDRWDGYQVIVPGGTRWRPIDNPPEIKEYDYTDIAIEGLVVAPCPFCKRVPEWVGVNKDRMGGGILIGASPHEYSTWWLRCCGYANSPHTTDPEKMIIHRNSLLSTEDL